MKKILLIFAFTAFIFSSSISHPWKPNHYVIIDTDCGLDDFRAIRLMLESTNIRILAITTSNGVVNAKDGYFKIKNLLNTNHHEGILVGANLNSKQEITGCKSAYDFSWGNIKNNNTTEIPSHTEVINQVLKNSNEKIIFINMGSLNTITNHFTSFPDFKDKIKEVLWACDYNLLKECFNYKIDSSSFQSFIDLNMPLSIINNGNINNYTDQVIENIRTYNTALSSEILKSITLKNNAFSRNFYDETTFLYLIKPEMFTQKMAKNFFTLTLQSDYQYFENVLDSVFKSQMINTQIFSVFPEQESAYVEDVREIMVETIKKYGKDEWASCVLTCEIHRPVGV
ncbi:MAG: nucleoside hydrolase, partial [Bacteroidota bacterium]